jgi:high affinity sulfate transporter 1
LYSACIIEQESVTLRQHVIPEWLIKYDKEWLRPDIVAGLTAGAVVIPKAMAYATIAGLPVQVGLYTAFLPMVIYAFLGTSRPLSVSTTTTLAILTAAELGGAIPTGDATGLLKASMMLTLLVGGFLALASLLRMGFIANFISEPVLVGFKAGIGVVIVLDQLPKILGIHFARGTFLQNGLSAIRGIPHTSPGTLIVGLAMLALLIGLEKFLPRAPAPLIAVAAGIIASVLFKLPLHGVELVGRVPSGLPPVAMPDFSLAARLWPGALGIALMSFTETIAAGRAFTKAGETAPQANRELLATGLANIGGAFFGSMAAGGGTTQTAVNRQAGACTQVSELVTAAMSMVTMLFLSPLIGLMPHATLAAVVIVYSVGLVKPQEFRDILRIRRTEFIWAVTAFAGVMLMGTLKGIVVAIIVSMVMLAYQASDPPVYVMKRRRGTNIFRPASREHAEDETFPGLLLLRLDGRFFFANAEHIGQKLKVLVEGVKPTVIALDLSGVPDLEYTALKMLTEAAKRQRQNGVSVWLVGLNPQVLNMVQRSPLGEMLGRDGLQFNLETAVAKYAGERGLASDTETS